MNLTTRIRRRIERTASEGANRIFFCHVPKCAGTAVAQAIPRQAYTLWQRMLLDDFVLEAKISGSAADAAEIPLMPLRTGILAYYLQQTQYKYATGHVACPPHLLDRFQDRWRFVTILRHPVRRVISAYVYNTYKRSEWARNDLPIETYLETPQAADRGNLFLRYFSSADWTQQPGVREQPRLIREAIETLGRFDVVGTVEDMAAWTARFRDAFGVELRIPRANASPRPEAADELRNDPRVMQRIEQLCAADIEIYEAVARSAHADDGLRRAS